MTKTCFFVSDLHMFAQRSLPHHYEKAIPDVVRQADVLVLGGDIFDFKWSTLSSTRATVQAAIDWLHQLIQLNPNCELHYVLGNHDYDPELMKQLDRFAEKHRQFNWHKFYLQIGTSLFLHGDVADRKIKHDQLVSQRSRWKAHKSKGRISNGLYDWAINLRLHKVVNLIMHQRNAVVKRLMFYLIDIGVDLENDIQNVYFGHTHAVVDGYHVAGITFHNGGAPFKGVDFQIIRAVI